VASETTARDATALQRDDAPAEEAAAVDAESAVTGAMAEAVVPAQAPDIVTTPVAASEGEAAVATAEIDSVADAAAVPDAPDSAPLAAVSAAQTETEAKAAIGMLASGVGVPRAVPGALPKQALAEAGANTPASMAALTLAEQAKAQSLAPSIPAATAEAAAASPPADAAVPTAPEAPAGALPSQASGAPKWPETFPLPSAPAPPPAPLSAAPPPPPLAVLDPGKALPPHAVPIEIGLKALQGVKEFQIRLDPAELGRVEVKLALGDDQTVSAKVVVDRVETLHLLQREAKTLERAFEQAGLRSTDGGIDISLRDPGQQGRGERRTEDTGPGPDRARGEPRALTEPPPQVLRRTLHRGALDVSI
jgi:flagellar hook-length control protein FliK